LRGVVVILCLSPVQTFLKTGTGTVPYDTVRYLTVHARAIPFRTTVWYRNDRTVPGTVREGTGTVPYGTVRCSLRYRTRRYNMVIWYITVRYGTVRHGTVRTVRHFTVPYNVPICVPWQFACFLVNET